MQVTALPDRWVGGMLLGGSPAGSGTVFVSPLKGVVEHMAVFDRALSPAEISAMASVSGPACASQLEGMTAVLKRCRWHDLCTHGDNHRHPVNGCGHSTLLQGNTGLAWATATTTPALTVGQTEMHSVERASRQPHEMHSTSTMGVFRESMGSTP